MTRRKKAGQSSEEALRLSESKFQALFKHCPISLREEDLSSVKQYLDKLRKKGVVDFRTYFKSHPDRLAKCASLVRIDSVNDAALAVFNALTPEEYAEAYSQSMNDVALERFGEELSSFMEGKTSIKFDSVYIAPDGHLVDMEMRASLAPGSEETFNRVFVSVVDVCELLDTIRLQERITDEVLETISKLTEIRDPYTDGHQRRVSVLMVEIHPFKPYLRFSAQ